MEVASDAPPSGDDLVAGSSVPRELTDPQAMRALAHPTRLALLEALLREGPLTATQAATLLDDSPGNLSWHFQTLAKYGFVEETGTGRGRSRPWRLASIGHRFSTTSASPPGVAAAGEVLQSVVYEQSYERVRAWRSARASFDPPWEDSAFVTQTITYLTPAELDELGDEVSALFHRYMERTLHRSRRPPGSAPVQLLAFGHPLVPNPSGN